MTKIYYGRDLIGRFKCDGRRYTKSQYKVMLASRMTKICLSIATVIVLGGWLFTAGVILAKGTIEPSKIYAKEIIQIEVDRVAPILERIAKCESTAGHMKNGKVVYNKNTNGSYDIGKYQINTLWLQKAAELGLDLNKEADNEAMAKWIYANRGTQDWYSSAHCWQK